MLNIGDKVIFDNEKVNDFCKETTSEDIAIKEYQKLILAGLNQIGFVKLYDPNLTIVSYADGWELPVPTKYLKQLY